MIAIIFSSWFLLNLWQLSQLATKPVDGILVLGGSISREIYAAQFAQHHPQLPVIISQGSPTPCIQKIWQHFQNNRQQVWLERCADSTFDNFVYTLPILQQFKIHRLKVITSASHLPRAQWIGQLILGSHGIWVDMDVVREEGRPGNRENGLKTTLDVIRSLFWSGFSHLFQPSCSQVTNLINFNEQSSENLDFHCEYRPRWNFP